MLKQRAEVLKAKLVAERRKFKSDAEFASALGSVKSGTLNKWLRSDPPVWPEQHLEEIARYFGTDIEGLTATAKTPKVKAPASAYRYAEEVMAGLDLMPRDEKAKLTKLLIDQLSVC